MTPKDFHRRRRLLSMASAAAVTTLAGPVACGGNSPSPAPSPPPPATAARTYKLGFSGIPPKFDTASVIGGIDRWSTRAEIAAIHEDLPWTDLLQNGLTPDAILTRDKVQLVQYYRAKGLQLYFMADPTNGLSRGEDAAALVAMGRSLQEPAVQQAYRDYVAAAVRMLRPDYIGLAAETNLIRAVAPAGLYNAVKQAANAAYADIAGVTTVPKFISVQVESAWGYLVNTPFTGIATDLRDFPFTQMIGLSSYPYFAFTQPEDMPNDYYSRVLAGSTLPAMVLEGGWTSATAGAIASNPDKQARYLARHAQLLDGINARGYVQLVFADLDLSTFPPPIPSTLPLFASIGLTDSSFGAKPALAVWDGLHARRLAP